MNQFERETLDSHNRFRASHHATPLAWNHSLASDAQAWADYLAHEDRLKHANTDDGENIYMSFGEVKMTGNVAVDKWYQEVKDYSFSRPGFQSNTGHFTQIVWRGSKEIGVGKAQGYDGKIFVVARYRPPGNNLRTFEENVLPAQRHMTNRDSTGWDHHNLNGSQFNNSDKHPNSIQNGTLGKQWRSSDRWDPVYDQDRYFPKTVLEENQNKSSCNYQEPSKTVPRQAKPNDPRPKMSNTGETGHNKYVDHKWDSGKWFDEDIIEPSITHTQHSSPQKKIFQDTSNTKGVNRNTSPGITVRWNPQGKETNKAKDTQGKQQWQNERKGFYRDSVGRNKSINKVRLSTEKWESISNEIEIDGRDDVKVGRSRTRESIKRWEEKNFNQPNLPFQYSASQRKLIKPSQSKQVYSERWDPLWGDMPLNDRRPRPMSWDSSRFNQDKTDNINQPRERKITTTIDEGPRKTVVSSVTIVLKGNESYRTGHKSILKSREDLECTKPNKSSNTWEDYQPFQAKEAHIVPEVKKHSYVYDATESPHGNRVTQPLYFSQQALEYHNNYRALHGAPSLIWSTEIARAAQAWAEKLAFERTLKHSSRERGADGENLAMFPADGSGNEAKKAIDMWYEEVRNYDFSRPGYQPRSGHFTQLVWKESKEFGMGRATTSDGELHVVVARYRPPGNVTRNYELNVFPKKSFF